MRVLADGGTNTGNERSDHFRLSPFMVQEEACDCLKRGGAPIVFFFDQMIMHLDVLTKP
jgi:hypothetical protein